MLPQSGVQRNARPQEVASSLFIGVLFVLGMVMTDGLNGLWISQLIARSDQVGVIASRVMSLGISLVSLLTAGFVATRLAVPNVDSWSNGHESTVGVAVIAIVLLSYLVARRLAPPHRGLK